VVADVTQEPEPLSSTIRVTDEQRGENVRELMQKDSEEEKGEDDNTITLDYPEEENEEEDLPAQRVRLTKNGVVVKVPKKIDWNPTKKEEKEEKETILTLSTTARSTIVRKKKKNKNRRKKLRSRLSTPRRKFHWRILFT